MPFHHAHLVVAAGPAPATPGLHPGAFLVTPSDQRVPPAGVEPAPVLGLSQGLCRVGLRGRTGGFCAPWCPWRDSNAHWQRPQRCASAVGLQGPAWPGGGSRACGDSVDASGWRVLPPLPPPWRGGALLVSYNRPADIAAQASTSARSGTRESNAVSPAPKAGGFPSPHPGLRPAACAGRHPGSAARGSPRERWSRGHRHPLCSSQVHVPATASGGGLAWAAGVEPATAGFGDQCSSC